MTNAADIKAIVEADKQSGRVKRAKRESGSGCLIPPRVGISRYWAVQLRDANGKQIRRTRLNSGAKVRGELKPGCDPSKVESWTNITAAKLLLNEWILKVRGGVAVGHDPSQLRYSDLRALLLRDYAEQKHKSLRKNSETGEDYLDSLPHLDSFMGWKQEGDEGLKVSMIGGATRDAFVVQREAEGASNATINRSLAALRRMFTLAVEAEILKYAPSIKMLPEPKQPRQGFLTLAEYERLHSALGEVVGNKAKGTLSQPYAYVQSLLQVGYLTGMRREEILGLRWENVDLGTGFIHLFAGETKNNEARDIPLIDGLDQLFESLKRARPNSDENDLVFLNNKGGKIGSFIKGWRNACIKAAIPTKINNVSTISHYSKGPDCCAACRRLSEDKPAKAGKYVGALFHDLRRSFVSNMTRAGLDTAVAKSISGHKTDSVFERYQIVTAERAREAGAKVSKFFQQQRDDVQMEKAEPKLRVVGS